MHSLFSVVLGPQKLQEEKSKQNCAYTTTTKSKLDNHDGDNAPEDKNDGKTSQILARASFRSPTGEIPYPWAQLWSLTACSTDVST